MFNQPPLSVMASWPVGNTVNPVSRGAMMIAVEVTMIVVVVTLVFLRLFARCFVVRSLAIDDWLIIPAAIFTISQAIASCIGVQYGWGIHAWDVIAIYGLDMATSFKLMLVVTVLFGLANTFTKLSILFFYRRLCTATNIARTINITIGVVCVWGFIVFWLGVFQCTPVSAFWEIITKPGAKCISRPFFKIYAATDIALDFFILVLPLKSLWDLHLSFKKRISLVLLFSFGGLTCIAGIMRLPSILTSMVTYDLPWEGPILEMWSTLELTVGIGCSCLPAIRSLFVIKPQIKSTNCTNTFISAKKATPSSTEILSTSSTTRFDIQSTYSYSRPIHKSTKSESPPWAELELRSVFPTSEDALQFLTQDTTNEKQHNVRRDEEEGLGLPSPELPPRIPRTAWQSFTSKRSYES